MMSSWLIPAHTSRFQYNAKNFNRFHFIDAEEIKRELHGIKCSFFALSQMLFYCMKFFSGENDADKCSLFASNTHLPNKIIITHFSWANGGENWNCFRSSDQLLFFLAIQYGSSNVFIYLFIFSCMRKEILCFQCLANFILYRFLMDMGWLWRWQCVSCASP